MSNRVGNVIRECDKCHRSRRHKARGLCDSCWRAVTVVVPGGVGMPARPFDAPADDAVIERVLGGERLPMNTAERLEVTRIWTEQRVSAAEIARRTGLSQRVVVRYRAKIHRETLAAA